MAAKLEAEFAGRNYTVDILLGGEPYNYPRWRKAGILEKFIDIIPGIEKWNRGMYSRYGDWVQPGNSPKVPQYNTNLVSAAEVPKNWEDLLNPKWKGKVAFEESLNFFIWNTENWGEEKTVDFLKKLRNQKPSFIAGPTQLTTLLSTGEYAIGVGVYLHRVIEQQEKGAPVRWAPINLLADDSLIAFNIIPKAAPHPNAARLWMRWWMTPEGQDIIERVRKKGDPAPGTGTKASKFIEKIGIEGLKIFTATPWISENYDRLRKKYQETIGFVTK